MLTTIIDGIELADGFAPEAEAVDGSVIRRVQPLAPSPVHPSFKTMASHASWEWPTPQKFYEELDRDFHFNFDPCPLGGEVDGRSTLFVPWAEPNAAQGKASQDAGQ